MTGAERCCSKLRISDSGPHRGFRQCQELPVLDSKQAQRHRILPKAGKKPRWEVKHRAHGGTQEEPYKYQLKSQSSYSFIVNLWPEIPIPSSGASQKPSDEWWRGIQWKDWPVLCSPWGKMSNPRGPELNKPLQRTIFCPSLDSDFGVLP